MNYHHCLVAHGISASILDSHALNGGTIVELLCAEEAICAMEIRLMSPEY